ncbi:hypothetical protein ZWY2020_045002 [Hordeum vulgare]|nr:hypothetical protein ZWY2020_045002 [Hordeum vulgare]
MYIATERCHSEIEESKHTSVATTSPRTHMGNVQPLPCTCKEAMVVHATVAMKAKRKKPLVANNVGGGTADQDGGKGKEATLPECRVRVEELAAGCG